MTRRHLLSSAAGFVLVASAMPANAQSVDQAAAAVPDETTDIVVYGRGETRQVQTLTAVDIGAAVPGTSPLKVLAKLPSVSFQSANPLGTNEWSTRIAVRGFSQSQLGFTLDGVPLGDMSYGNFNGLHISRAIASENIGSTRIAQGAGSLDTPSSSNLGGTIQFFSKDPEDTMNVDAEASFGSNNNLRLFGRVESGDLGGGVKGYVSGSFLDAPKWKGQGKQEAWTINSKLVVPLNDTAKITTFANYSNYKDDDYMDTSPALIKKFGWDWDYLRNDYATALAIASNLQSGTYCASYAGYSQTICGDDTYYDGYGLRKDLLLGATLDATIGGDLTLKLTPYYHHNDGIGTWWTPYTPTPGGASLSVRSTAYEIDRGGLTGSLSYKIANHELSVGGWYEHNAYNLARLFYPLAAGATSSLGPREWPKNPFYTQYSYNFTINTLQYFVQDSWQVTDAFKINAGFKGLQVKIDNEFDPVSGDATRDTSGKLKAKDMFLPQVGANYTLSNQFELFASYAENMRAYTTEPFQTNKVGFAAIKDKIKPETSWTVEGGLRFHLPKFEGSIAGYHVKFDNRLLSVQPCPIVVGCASALSNVGSVTTNGVEVAGTYNITRAFSLYGSYAYTDGSYDQDTRDANGVLLAATKDKSVIAVPKHLINGEIAYDDGAIIGRLNVAYQSKRYYTYSNDASVKGYALVDLTAGYRFHTDDMLNGLELQVNVTNLFDKKYIATIGQNGFAYSDPGGTLQSMLVGAPRQVFATLRKKF